MWDPVGLAEDLQWEAFVDVLRGKVKARLLVYADQSKINSTILLSYQCIVMRQVSSPPNSDIRDEKVLSTGCGSRCYSTSEWSICSEIAHREGRLILDSFHISSSSQRFPVPSFHHAGQTYLVPDLLRRTWVGVILSEPPSAVYLTGRDAHHCPFRYKCKVLFIEN